MKEIILIKNGELALKGLNRSSFEDMLIKNIRRRLQDVGRFSFRKSQSTIMVEPAQENADLEEAAKRLQKVFGIARFSRCGVAKKELDDILAVAGVYLKEQLEECATFKVEAKRSDKRFPLNSPEICVEVGGYLLERFPHLSVDVHHPDCVVTVEIRDRDAYIHGNPIRGAGGMPVGSSGKAAVLISGGIDSPVAAWMMAKRGLELHAVHFASPPYTSERAELKVKELLHKVAAYSGWITMQTVPFTEIQEAIKETCPEELFTIIMRRFMMKISSKLAEDSGAAALITGESVGQVASQTMYAMACTDAAAGMQVYRPCIGMDKEEIISISRKIDTFDISIEPYEDCCTVFTPKHPRTRPKLRFVEQAEVGLDMQGLIERAIAGVKTVTIR